MQNEFYGGIDEKNTENQLKGHVFPIHHSTVKKLLATLPVHQDYRDHMTEKNGPVSPDSLRKMIRLVNLILEKGSQKMYDCLEERE